MQMERGFIPISGDPDRSILVLWNGGLGRWDRRDFRDRQPHHFDWIAVQPDTLLYRGDGAIGYAKGLVNWGEGQRNRMVSIDCSAVA